MTKEEVALLLLAVFIPLVIFSVLWFWIWLEGRWDISSEIRNIRREMEADMERFRREMKADMERFHREMRADMEKFHRDVKADLRR